MAVAAPDGRLLALPLPYLAEAWQTATGVLAETAARDHPSASDRWLKVARREAARLLDRVRDVPAPHTVSTPSGPVVVLPFGERHLLAVTVAASLSPRLDAGPAARAVAAVRPGVRLPGPAGSLDVPRDAEVVGLVVLATAGAAVAGSDAQDGRERADMQDGDGGDQQAGPSHMPRCPLDGMSERQLGSVRPSLVSSQNRPSCSTTLRCSHPSTD
jgi:hypothetical protein